jgi:PHB de-polymerase C-terminus
MCETLSKQHDGAIVHTLGVCQPAVPLIAAIALMEAQDSPHVPVSMTLMGGAIDARRSQTKVNLLVQERGSAWFERNCICVVPFGYPGGGRDVYPGFLQLTGFMGFTFPQRGRAPDPGIPCLDKGSGESPEAGGKQLRMRDPGFARSPSEAATSARENAPSLRRMIADLISRFCRMAPSARPANFRRSSSRDSPTAPRVSDITYLDVSHAGETYRINSRRKASYTITANSLLYHFHIRVTLGCRGMR